MAALKRQAAPRKPSPIELAKRENVFRVYRDLGATRSYRRLQIAIRDTHGTVSARVLNAWSKEHGWKERLLVHDDEAAKAASVNAPNPEYDPNFDIEEKLLHSAQVALTRALEANVTPSNPHQQKALVDAAINALKAVELRRQGRRDKGEMATAGKRVSSLLDAIEARIRDAYAQPKPVEVIDVEVEEVGVTPAQLQSHVEDIGSVEADQGPALSGVQAKPAEASSGGGEEPAPAPAEEYHPDVEKASGPERANTRLTPKGDMAESHRTMTVAERLALRRQAS